MEKEIRILHRVTTYSCRYTGGEHETMYSIRPACLRLNRQSTVFVQSGLHESLELPPFAGQGQSLKSLVVVVAAGCACWYGRFVLIVTWRQVSREAHGTIPAPYAADNWWTDSLKHLATGGDAVDMGPCSSLTQKLPPMPRRSPSESTAIQRTPRPAPPEPLPREVAAGRSESSDRITMDL